MQLNEGLRIQWAEGQANIHQPRVRQHEDDEVQRALLAADLDTAQLAGINLTLHTGDIIQNGLIVALLR